MDVTRPVVIGLGLVAGSAAAIGLYAAVAPTPSPVKAKQVSSTSRPAIAPQARRTSVVFAPCTPPATLEGQTCVTRTVVTTVVAAPAAASPGSGQSQPAAARPAASPESAGSDEAGEDDAEETEDHAEDTEDHADEREGGVTDDEGDG